MALSPYKSHQNSLNRIRSSSCSSPMRNRIVFQEIYSVGSNTLVRSYSCDQMFAKGEAGQTFQTTKIQVSSFMMPEKKFSETGTEEIKESQTEPKKSASRLSTPDTCNAKKLLKMGSPAPKPPCQVLSIFLSAMKFSMLPLLSACLFYLYMSQKDCGYVWNLKETNKELAGNVLGQSDALTKIELVLNFCNSTNDIFIMIFTGGIGVGKTLASSIINRNFPWNSKKFITYSGSFKEEERILSGSKFSPCGVNLMTVDDLSPKHTIESINFMKFLYGKREKNEKLLVILIFLTKNEFERNYVLKDFRNTDLNFYHIPFQNLTEGVVRECFKREIKRQQIHILEKELVSLVKNKLKYVNIIKGLTGCKGVADEVFYYHEKDKK